MAPAVSWKSSSCCRNRMACEYKRDRDKGRERERVREREREREREMMKTLTRATSVYLTKVVLFNELLLRGLYPCLRK